MNCGLLRGVFAQQRQSEDVSEEILSRARKSERERESLIEPTPR